MFISVTSYIDVLCYANQGCLVAVSVVENSYFLHCYWLCVCVYLCVCVCVSLCVCVCVCVSICMLVCAHVYACV